MISDKNIKLILQILLFTSLGMYILIGELPEILMSEEIKKEPSTLRLINLMKIGAIIISVFTILSSFKWKPLLKIIFGKDYVSGEYVGYSEKISEDDKPNKKHGEEFEISQSLISTKISGLSKNEEGEFYSQWRGRLIEVDNGHFHFLIDMETPKERSYGLMTLNFKNGEVNGFGLSIEAGMNHKWRFKADLKK
jgi:hypothetical protein